MTRKISLALSLIVLMVLMACETDDLNFEDQDLQGKIEGKEWVLNTGMGKTTASSNLFLIFSSNTANDPCVLENQATYGVKAILSGMDPDTYDTNSGSIYFYGDNGAIAGKISGAIKITSVNSATVVGMADLKIDDDNYINGNFSISMCP